MLRCRNINAGPTMASRPALLQVADQFWRPKTACMSGRLYQKTLSPVFSSWWHAMI